MPQAKQVLMMVYGFVPDDPRVITEARTMTQAGYRVVAIGAGFPGGQSGDFSRDGIAITIIPPVNRLTLIPRALIDLVRGNVRPQITPQDPRPASNAISLTFYFLWILRLALFRRFDLIHAHEHQSMPVGWLLATLKRVPWIYDAHEHVPENRADFGTFKARMAVRTEAFFIRRADTVITVGERLKQDLHLRGVKRVVIVGNWKPLDRYAPPHDQVDAKRTEYALDRFRLVVSYFGVLSHERQVDILIEALAELPDVGLLIAGKGDLRDRVIAAAQAHDNILYLDWIPYDLVPVHVFLSDVIYACLLADEGNARFMAPNKLFDAFAAGKAMIARRGVGEIGEILQKENAAILLDQATPQTVRQALETLRDDRALLATLQENARTAGQHYNWSVAEERLQALYQSLIAGERG